MQQYILPVKTSYTAFSFSEHNKKTKKCVSSAKGIVGSWVQQAGFKV